MKCLKPKHSRTFYTKRFPAKHSRMFHSDEISAQVTSDCEADILEAADILSVIPQILHLFLMKRTSKNPQRDDVKAVWAQLSTLS